MPLEKPGDTAVIVDGMRAAQPGYIPFVEIRMLREHNDFYRHYVRTDSFPEGWKIGDTVRLNDDYDIEIVREG